MITSLIVEMYERVNRIEDMIMMADNMLNNGTEEDQEN
jgi:hypothetical protein